jgi:hypothetical protein
MRETPTAGSPDHQNPPHQEQEVFKMVLHLLLSVRSESIVNTVFGGIGAFEKYLNEHPAWTYTQEDAKEWVNGKAIPYPPSIILLSGNIKVILSLPLSEDKDGSHHKIITIKNTRRVDRADALAAAEVTEPIRVDGNTPTARSLTPRTTSPPEPPKPVPPEVPTVTESETATQSSLTRLKTIGDRESQQEDDRQRFVITPICPQCATKLVPKRGIYCQSCGHALPPELAVHQEVVVSIRIEDYRRLARHLIHKVNRALGALMQGRKLERVITSMGQRILLVALEDEMRTSTATREQILNDLLVETGIGRLSTDTYEVKQAHEMADGEDSMPLP